MNEADIVNRLVDYTNILLAGITVYFTIVSGYVAAMNYFVGQANLPARIVAYLFVSVVLLMLIFVMWGAQNLHIAMIAALDELDKANELGAVGRAALENTRGGYVYFQGYALSIDWFVRGVVYIIFGTTYLVLFYMSFLHDWKRDVTPVEIVKGAT